MEMKLIDAIERIAKIYENSKMSEKRVTPAKKYVDMVGKRLRLKHDEALVLSLMFYIGLERNNVDMSDLKRHMDCMPTEVVRYTGAIEELKNKKYIIKAGRHQAGRRSLKQRGNLFDTDYCLRDKVKDAIIANRPEMIETPREMGSYDFLDEVDSLIETRYHNEMGTADLIDEVENLIEEKRKMDMVSKMHKLKLNRFDMLILFFMFNRLIEGEKDVDLGRMLALIYDSIHERMLMKRIIVQGDSKLMSKKLISLQKGNFRGDSEILLTEKAVDLFFEQDKELLIKGKMADKRLVQPKDIPSMRLYYNTREEKEISELTSSLRKTNYKRIRSRLRAKNMPTGIAALFYGYPGTGKTETAMQIARVTGRGVIPVDISQTKSMWFGESERIIKQVFSDYRQVAKNAELAPILLFNEADAVLGKRKDSSTSSVAQTENAIQNIILEEMEKLEGIMIATTNLSANLDSAFDRRFLFKLEFDEPGTAVMEKIWQDKINQLSTAQANLLAGKYGLTGGQIANVARKLTMQSVIKGDGLDMDELENYCRAESGYKSKKRIGFSA